MPDTRARQRRPAAIRGILLTALIVLAFIVGALLWLAWPRHRTATAYLQVLERRSVVFNDEPPPSAAEFARKQSGLLAFATSPLVLETALQSRLAPKNDSSVDVERLRQALAVNFSGDGSVMQLSMTCFHDDPDDDKRLLDAVVLAFRDNVLMQHRLEESTRSEDMRRVLGDLHTKIRELQSAINGKPAMAGDPEFEMLKSELEANQDLYKSLNMQVLKAHAIQRLEESKAATPRPGEDAGYPIRIIQKALISD
jgi:hypothetical protein